MTPRSPFLLCVLLAPMLLSGCVVRAAYDVATVPVHAAGKAVDWTTTSRAESDRNRGRALRRRDEELGKLQRAYQRDARACADGDRHACYAARDKDARIERLRSDASI